MIEIKKDVPNGRIEGVCDERFAAVADEFERSFRERDEVGASVCATLEATSDSPVCAGAARVSRLRLCTREPAAVALRRRRVGTNGVRSRRSGSDQARVPSGWG